MAEPLRRRLSTPGEEEKRPESPKNPFFTPSTDERAQSRAAAIPVDHPPTSDPCLSRDQVLELLQNCLKLASENKINKKNIWELRLIDHLSEVLKVTCQADAETHFQKASCSLEAGVKIYSLRVDSVHAEAYKVLAGIIRAGHGNDQEHVTIDANDRNGRDASPVRKETEKEISPLSTVESSFEALEKKFNVDPAYHHTYAQFDEGGAAKGLLLNNLGIYGKCEILYDSFDVPGKCRSSSLENDALDVNQMIDVSFAEEFIEQMMMNMLVKKDISPTLQEIMCQLADDNIRSSQTFDAANGSGVESNETCFQNYERLDCDLDERTASESSSPKYPSFQSYPQKHPYTMDEPDPDDKTENVSIFLFQKLGLTSKQNTWAGLDHWKYRKYKGKDGAPAAESEPVCTPKKVKSRNIVEADIGFVKHLESEVHAIFSPPKNPNSLLLPSNRAPCCNTLPEDYHYQPEGLVKLFLLPNYLCLGKRRWEVSDYSRLQNDSLQEASASWDNESTLSGHYDDSYIHVDVNISGEQITQPRQVNKFEVQCDRTSKWIDVNVLKETLWDHIQNTNDAPKVADKDVISFKNVLATFPVDHQAAPPQNISPHLCFICLLHLANEHGLNIRGCPDLDDLTIQLRSPIATL